MTCHDLSCTSVLGLFKTADNGIIIIKYIISDDGEFNENRIDLAKASIRSFKRNS